MSSIPVSYRHAWYCSAALTLCWFITSMYLPAIPSLQHALGTSESMIKFIIAIYFLFFCFGQILWGPISDNHRRNSVLILTLGIATVGTLLCTLATNVWLFLLGRMLQGFGIGSIPVLSRSIVNDHYSEAIVMRIMIYLTSVVAIASAIAPVLGAGLLNFFSWRSIFVFLLAFCFILIAIYYSFVELGLQKTIDPKEKRTFFQNYWVVMKNREIWFYFTSYFLIISSLVAFYSASPYILIDILGVSPNHYSLLLLLASAFYIAAILVVRVLITNFSANALLLFGMALCLLGGLTLFVISLFKAYSLWSICIPMAIYFFGSAFIPPITNSKAMHVLPKFAGTVSSLMGTGLSLGSAILSYLLLNLPFKNLMVIGIFFSIIPLFVIVYALIHGKNRPIPSVLVD